MLRALLDAQGALRTNADPAAEYRNILLQYVSEYFYLKNTYLTSFFEYKRILIYCVATNAICKRSRQKLVSIIYIGLEYLKFVDKPFFAKCFQLFN
jgi:hypothetical protein